MAKLSIKSTGSIKKEQIFSGIIYIYYFDIKIKFFQYFISKKERDGTTGT